MSAEQQDMHPRQVMPEDLERPQRARLALTSIVISIGVLLTWAAFARIDQVTRAPIQLIAAARTQMVQSADGGVVTRLHVKEGDVVTKGQLLVTLEKERASSAVDDSQAKVAALRTALARLQAELFGKPLVFDKDLQAFPEYIRNQTALYQRRTTAFREDVASLERVRSITEEELAINEKLLASGDVSRAEVLRLKRTAADVTVQIMSRKNKYYQDAQAEMTKAQEDLSTQQEQLRDRTQLLEHTELVAPADGVVNNIRATTPGAVVRASDVVLELLPTQDDLLAEAKVVPADIAFVKVGQSAFVKLDAFDSTVFGGLRGEVSYISPDVLKEETKNGPITYYRVHVRIVDHEFKGKNASDILLRPGLSGQVDIKALERSVLSYITKPITKTLGEALGER